MDAEIELPDRKKQKVVCEMVTGEDEDIISQLPDSILHHILSFRSTKRAVSTSILSKRWKDLWMSTTNLYFKTPYYYKDKEKWKNQFTQFVDQVLRYHSSDITRFNLSSSVESTLDAICVESWISAAVQRRVQMIHLSTRLVLLALPCCLCTSEVLRALELSSSCYIQLPSVVWLPSLKILRLVDVKFIDDISFNRLFSGLPNIKELEINNCGWDNIKNVGISLPTLKWLRLVVGGYLSSDQDVVVKVSAINLQYLDCHANLSINFIIDSMPSLEEAKIEFPYRRIDNEVAVVQHAANLFNGLCFAKSIKIVEEVIEYLHYYFKLKNVNLLLPKFVNLTLLELDSRVTGSTAIFVITILHNAPLLETLVIKEAYGGKWSIKPYPRCIEFNLKSCSILRFNGRPADILFVKFLIQAANVLEKLKINCSVFLQCQQDKLGDVKHLLEKLPRSSKSCVIEFL